MSGLLNDEIVQQVKEVFADLKQPVAVLFFEDGETCEYCTETHQLLEELTGLDEKLNLTVYNMKTDAEIAKQYHVDKTPGVVIAAQEGDEIMDYGIRYAGIPSGHEFTSLINDLILVSSREAGLSESVQQYLQNLDKPVKLQVFVTPTCPYCPRAVVLAHQMAMASKMIEAEMVEAMEFPELSDQFGVSGVPHTVINAGAGNVIGAVPEDHLLQEIKRVLA